MSIDNIEIIIGIVATSLSIVIPYYLTKKSEQSTMIKQATIQREFHLRQVKLEKYDHLISALTRWINDPSNREFTHHFLDAYNRASAYASNEVLQKIQELLDDIQFRKNVAYTNAGLIDQVFVAIRKDVHPDEPEFPFKTRAG